MRKKLSWILIICGLLLLSKPLLEHGYNFCSQLLLRSEVKKADEVSTPGNQEKLSNLPIEPPFVLEIPVISVDAVVIEGVTQKDLRRGPGLDPRGVDPGTKGNVIIAAHNNVYGAGFKDLHKLKPGDMVFISSGDCKLTYRVEDLVTIHENDKTTIFDPTENRMLTLITCAPPSGSGKRVIVTARQEL